jgi:uncharacterized protein
MTLVKKIREIEKVYENLDKDIRKFQISTQLKCISGCGECCKKPDIEATALEFLPLAYYLYKKGVAFDYLEKIKNSDDAYCILFSPFIIGGSAGGCNQYPYRGLVCRLFGFSAFEDKHGAPMISTCKIIKTTQAENYALAVEKVKNGEYIPIMSDFYMKIYGIDIDMGRKFYPINTAMRFAIEKVLSYYAYRGKRAS